MFRYIKARFWQFAGVAALLVISMAVIGGGSIVRQRLIDAVIGQDLSGVKLYIPLAVGYSLFSMSLYVVYTICQNLFKAAFMNDVRLSVFDGIIRRSRRDFAQNPSADYVSALTNDMGTIQGQFLGMLFMEVTALSTMLFSAALMFYYQPLAAACAILSALVMTAAPLSLGRITGRWQGRRSERLAALTAMLSECFGGFETITTFGIQRHIRRKFRECSEALRNCEYRTEGLGALSDGLSQLLSSLAQTAIFTLSCWMAFTGRMTIGALVVFTPLTSSFCSTLSTYLTVTAVLKSVKPIIGRVNGYADYTCTDSQGDAEPAFREAIAVREVSFGYDTDSLVLDNLSLTLRRGGKYALTGESGSGKSTLIRLLLGDYPDYEGGIYYDGTELRRLRRDKLNRVAVCIHQDVFLFDDTIRNNICLFEEFSEEAFEWAVRASGVQKFAEAFPEGTSYVVGERGERLSGGQRQRVAIARALIRHTDLLILDEGTSALDEPTAAEIESGLLRLENLTLLTITHHLENPQEYDEVFVLGSSPRPAGE